MSTVNSLPIVVYSTPGCVQCNLTKQWLTSKGLQFRDVDVSEDESALQHVKAMGYAAAPVVVVPFDWPIGGEHWYGFRPDKLAQLIG